MISSKEGWWMKRLAAILLSLSLVCALSFLGGTGTAAGSTPAVATASDTPTVTGGLLNPAYFAHGAYVMQGVSDPVKAFALPLLGVPELSFFPTASGIDPSTVTWSVATSHPDGISAEIRDDTLYIWGNSAAWSGYGTVTLTGTASGVTGSVAIPVTVFRTDKTLINPEGKKDYFIPWSPQLDINRFLSVEEHIRKYNKDEGRLDRTIQFSCWRAMEYRHDVDVASGWVNEFVTNGRWPESTQLRLVDVYLDDMQRLGIDGIRILNEYYIATATATQVGPIYDQNLTGLTKRTEEEAYIINEAHRRNMRVSMGNLVSIGGKDPWAELFYASPQPLSSFFASLRTLDEASLAHWVRWGVDIVDLCPAVSSMNEYHNTREQATEIATGIAQLVESARVVYPGPLYHGAHFQPEFSPGTSIVEAPFWGLFDIIGLSAWNIDLTNQGWGMPPSSTQQATQAQLERGWRELIDRYYSPFQQTWNKPFLLWENGVVAARGCANYGLVCPVVPGFDGSRVSLGEMKTYYLAQDAAFRGMVGYFGPGWYSWPFSAYYRGGVRDTVTSTPRLKLEDAIQEICLGAAHPRTVQIDGRSDDWIAGYTVGTDPLGDARGANDIVGLAFTQDDQYLYFNVAYAAAPTSPGLVLLRLDTNGDGYKELELFLNNIWTDIHDWVSELYLRGLGSGPAAGFADAIDAGNSLELRLARRFLDGYLGGCSLHVQVAHFDRDWNLQDETPWFAVDWCP
jgi:hypothetical protein